VIHHNQATPTPPSRVVVLGASGFVGGDLMCHLRSLRIPTLGLSSRDVDLSQPQSVDRLTELIRPDDALVFASTITPDRGRDVRTLMRNLTMGEHVAAFLEKSPIDHVVYISSDAVYDDHANPVREDTPCNPGSFHGVMHLTRERMLAHAVRKTPWLAVRATLLYGPQDTHNGYGPNRFMRTALKEGTIKLFGQGEEKRDHLYIEDLSRLLGEALLRRSEGVLNVATGRSVSFGELAHLVAELRGGSVAIECLPRATSITHRHFDVTEALRGFPSLRYSRPRAGLAKSLAVLAGKEAA
jgi:UDP-glucose 4-epimerase